MQRTRHDHFSREKLSKHCMYTITDASHFDDPWWKAKNRWHSVGTHIHDGAGNVALSLFPTKVAKTLIMHSNYQIASKLPDLQDQKSFTLRWCSYSEWCREDASANKYSVRAEWLRQSGHAPSEPSETPRWLTTPRLASMERVALYIALRSLF